jgi:hypothetical protein
MIVEQRIRFIEWVFRLHTPTMSQKWELQIRPFVYISLILFVHRGQAQELRQPRTTGQYSFATFKVDRYSLKNIAIFI